MGVLVIPVAFNSEAYGDAAVIGVSFMFGEGAAYFLRNIDIASDLASDAGGVAVNQASNNQFSEDCHSCIAR